MRAARRAAAALVLSLAAVLAVLAAPATAKTRADSISGGWTLTFTTTSLKTVGQMLRGGDPDFGCDNCQSQYRFAEPRDGAGLTTSLILQIASEPCAAPCTLTAAPSGSGHGFRGTVSFDGTSYTLRGSGFESITTCPGLRPGDLDTGTFTVTGSGRDARISGTLTALLGVTWTGDCGRLVGYDLYTGTITGQPFAGAFPRGSSGTTGGPVTGAPFRGLSALERRALPDRMAAVTHTRPVLSTGVADARTLPWRPSAVLASALLALLLVVLMPFPAALFNATLGAHYDEVRGWFRFLPRRDAAAPERHRWRDFAVMVGAAALLNAFLDPHLKADRASAVLVLGLALSIAATSLIGSIPARAYMRRAYQERARVKLLPVGLVVAAVCVLVSRLTSFEPGYLYGVVAGFAFSHALSHDEEGRLSFATSLFLLAVAVAAFVIRIPVHDATRTSESVPLALLDTVLAAVFAAGVEANVLGLVPLRFLPGERLYRWRRPAWAVVFGLSLFAFLHALAATAGQARTSASVTVAAVLFLGFGAVSVTFWAYFRFRRTSPEPASV